MELENIAKVCKALSDETRLKIFEMLRNGKLCACKILDRLNIAQPTLSHHMKWLCRSGLVVQKREGKWKYYSINCSLLKEVNAFMSNTACQRTPIPTVEHIEILSKN